MPDAPAGHGDLWRETPYNAAVTAAFEAAGHSPILARLLAARGVTPETREFFLDPCLKRLAPAETLPGVRDAVAAIAPFVRDGRKIVVFGDYDADGVCASAILVSVLRRLGACVDAFIPERLAEGYGMTEASLARLLREHPDLALVITVDNGITSAVEVAHLRARGIAVVVTDHHLPPAATPDGEPARLPEAEALIDPKVHAAPGLEDLCGAGVAFFLAQALVGALRAQAEAKGLLAPDARLAGPLLVLAGLATVADLMPLRGQNRLLVTAAVVTFRSCAPVGLRELFDRAARKAGPLVARDFAFQLAPRLNAAGRMASARLAYELLMTEDREEARRLAVEIDARNVERKTEEARMDKEARAQIQPGAAREAVVVAEARRTDGAPPWHSGVAGIVASRILEDFRCPVAVVVGDHGSCRAPEGYNIRAALDAAADTLVRYGGHAAAGGFTVKEGRLDDFQKCFTASCAAQRVAAPEAAALPFDMWVARDDLTMALADELKVLEPYGEANPEPVFGLRDVYFSDARPMGVDGRHAWFSFAGRRIPQAVWWGHGADAEIIRAHAAARYDILFTVTTSDYGTEQPHVELRLVAVRAAAQGGGVC